MRSSFVALGLLLASPVSSDGLEHIGTFEWDTDIVTGLSGIEVEDDGLTFAMVGDRGWWLEGQFLREGDSISGLNVDHVLPIIGIGGYPTAARRVNDWSDAEGLAIGPSGTIWISFERYARAWSYIAPDAQPEFTQDHPDFKQWDDNRQLEAIAVDGDGAFYAFPETAGPDGFPVYRHAGAGWEVIGHLPASDSFSVVGADFDDSGALWVLERKLAYFWWWQNRIRRVDVATMKDEVIWTGKRGEFHNLEGIAVWRDEDGLRFTLVSDDNQSTREETQFVEFRLTD